MVHLMQQNCHNLTSEIEYLIVFNAISKLRMRSKYISQSSPRKIMVNLIPNYSMKIYKIQFSCYIVILIIGKHYKSILFNVL